MHRRRGWSALGPLFVGAALLATCSAEAKNNGKFECPCITGDAALREKVKPVLEDGGLPLNYGMDGCSAYDSDSPSCTVGDPPAWCTQEWCYIDQDKCPVNREKCTEAGGTVGSGVSPYCETRQHHASHIVPNSTVPLMYSYSTCDSLNLYDSLTFGSSVAGSTIKSTVLDGNPPFSIKETVDERKPEWLGFSGVLMDIVDYIRQGVKPNMGLKMVEGWASKSARKHFSSSYTACVYDVIVGNYDVCLGDFWITPSRLDMMSKQPGQPAQFLIPFREDKIYLVSPSIESSESFGDLMEKPFLPFKPDLWGLVIGFTIFSSLVSALIDKHNDTDYHNKFIGSRIIKSLFLHGFWYVSGGPLHYPVSVPSRLASLGFGLFTLITLATFTANLASLLVTKNLVSGIQSIEQAIDLGLTMCIPEAMAGQVMAEYPKGRYLQTPETWDVTQYMSSGKCDVGISAEIQTQMCNGGMCVERDCRLEEEGGLEEGSLGCVRNADGTPYLARDCRFKQVGNVIIAIPISLPVSAEYAATFNLYLRDFTAKGLYDKAWKAHEHKIPLTQCVGAHSNGGARRSQPQSPAPSLDSYHDTADQGRRAGGGKAKAGGATGGGAAESAAAAVGAGGGGNTEIEDMRLGYEALLGTVVVGCCVYVVAAFLAVLEWWFDRPVQSIFGFPYNKDSEEDERSHIGAHAHSCLSPRRTSAMDLGCDLNLGSGNEFNNLGLRPQSGADKPLAKDKRLSTGFATSFKSSVYTGDELHNNDMVLERLLESQASLLAKLDQVSQTMNKSGDQNPPAGGMKASTAPQPSTSELLSVEPMQQHMAPVGAGAGVAAGQWHSSSSPPTSFPQIYAYTTPQQSVWLPPVEENAPADEETALGTHSYRGASPPRPPGPPSLPARPSRGEGEKEVQSSVRVSLPSFPNIDGGGVSTSELLGSRGGDRDAIQSLIDRPLDPIVDADAAGPPSSSPPRGGVLWNEGLEVANLGRA